MSDLFGDRLLRIDARYASPRVVYDGFKTIQQNGYECCVGKATHTGDVVIGIVSPDSGRHQFILDARELVQEGLRLLRERRTHEQ